MAELRLLALYPEQMNIYADRGNVLFLQHRCEWRGIGFSYAAAGIGEGFDPDAHDLIYIGGGQDRDQRMVAADLLATKRDAIEAAVAGGVAGLAVCGGYQLLGSSYQLGEERIEGLGIAALHTVREAGPAADRQRLDRGRPRLRAAGPGRLREPRRPHLHRRRRRAARTGPARPRQQRPRRPRGDRPREPDRHLPARAAAAEERLAGRRADRPGDRAPRGRARPELAPLDDALRGRRPRRRRAGGRARI